MHEEFLREAIRLSADNARTAAGGPFGAVVVRSGEIVGRGVNQVTSQNDPTAHAEIVAIRDACRRLQTFSLSGCTLYASCEPCPMCLAAIYWARMNRVCYAAARGDAAAIGFDDAAIDRELARHPAGRSIPVVQMLRDEALVAMRAWSDNERRMGY